MSEGSHTHIMASGKNTYKPFDYEAPVTTHATCTHKESTSRNSVAKSDCQGKGSKALCQIDSNCYYNPDAPVLI